MKRINNYPTKTKYWEYSDVKFELTIYECLDRGIPLEGNYIIFDMYDGTRKVGIITREFLDMEDRLFQLDFNIHHRLMIGLK